jgi:hypothetical protein
LIGHSPIHFVPTIIGRPDNAGFAELTTHNDQFTMLNDQCFTTQLRSELQRQQSERGFQSQTSHPWQTHNRLLFSVFACAMNYRQAE